MIPGSIASVVERASAAWSSRRYAPADVDVYLPDLAERLARSALQVAIGEIGNGERGGNNLGPDVARYLAPVRPPKPWCAGFGGWCFEEAARREFIPLPFRRSLSSKTQGERIAAVGRKFYDPRLLQPGDVMVLHRGARDSVLGHFTIFERIEWTSNDGSLIYVIEGNAGSSVRRFPYPWQLVEDRLAFFASLRR